MRQGRALFGVSLFVIGLFALVSAAAFRNPNILPRELYSYDEADYVYAAEKGIVANYVDEGAISIAAFVEAGLAAGFDTTKWRELSRFIRATDDVTFYRHFHGPIYFYWLATVQALGFTSEASMRYASLCAIAFTTVALIVLIRALFPVTFAWTSLPLATLLLTGPSIVLTANHVTPHALYMLPSLLSVGTLSLYCATRNVRYWYGSVIATALAFATLEYALFLIVTMAATLLVFRRRLLAPLTSQERHRFAIVSLACFIVPLAVSWPGGIVKLTLVKNYCYYVYYTLVRGGSYGRSSLTELWSMRLEESPAEYAVVLVAIGSLPVLLKRFPHLLPPILYGLLIAFTTIRNKSTYPQYVSSAFPVFYLIAAAALNLALLNKSRLVKCGFTLTLTLLVATSAARFFLTVVETSRQPMPFQITSLEELRPLLADKDTPIVVNQPYVPTLHYYSPDSNLYSYNAFKESFETILARIEHILTSERRSAIVIFDAPKPETAKRIGERFLIEDEGTAFLSPRIPRATWYRIGGTRG